jgi:hypothetical protein
MKTETTCPPAGGKITAPQIEQARKESTTPPAGLPVGRQAGRSFHLLDWYGHKLAIGGKTPYVI